MQRQLAYRAEIDGLRAWAVCPVVLFHAGVAPVSGGFIGVDVFFVISGYLITRLILAELEDGKFRFVEFYRRRIKRLLPAYALVATFVGITGFMIFMPKDLGDLGKTLISTAFFASNMYFWRESGYFSSDAEINPLLHTWSLAVEEQFYFLFPILIVFLSRFGRRCVFLFLLITAFFSLWLSQYFLEISSPTSFYLLPARAWELAIGSLLAFRPTALERLRGDAGATLIGLIGIVVSSLAFDRHTPFPGIAALLPTISTALIIVSSEGTMNHVSRIALENRFTLFIGRISYSLYLWHWPLFSFWFYYYGEHPNLAAAAVLIVASIALAWISYVGVEQPTRAKDRFLGWRPFAFAATLSISIAGVGAIYWRTGGVPERLTPELQTTLAVAQGNADNSCVASAGNWRPPQEACTVGNAQSPQIAVWGDSHARAFMNGFAPLAAAQGQTTALLSHAGCPPSTSFRFFEAGFRCEEYNRLALEYMTTTGTIETVIIVARHAIYTDGLSDDLGPAERGRSQRTIQPVSKEGMRNEPIALAYEDRLRFAVDALMRANKRVVLVSPVPEVGYNVPRLVGQRLWRGDNPDFLHSRRAYDARQATVSGILKRVAAKTGATFVDITGLFCDNAHCSTYAGGHLLYYDDNHISPFAARAVGSAVLGALRRTE